ncbi:MAG: hypothetical protein FJ027_22805 [Candidatus Rokubacteria bacterium]|nr:hypothetical protein [Candidatus Rokubacteria bacterium]
MRRALAAVLCGILLWCTPGALASDEAFTRLRRLATTRPSGPQGPVVTHLLGLTGPRERLEMHQIKAAAGEDMHYFNVAADGSGRTVLFSRLGADVFAFVVDAQMNATAAAVRRGGGPWTAAAVESIRPQLQQQLGFWMDWALRDADRRGGRAGY